MDGEPWSPELLDWLASDFVEKWLRPEAPDRDDPSSRTYQMPAVARRRRAAGAQICVRGPEVRRITAEQFADAIGSITGEWHVYLPGAGLRGPSASQGEKRPNAAIRA